MLFSSLWDSDARTAPSGLRGGLFTRARQPTREDRPADTHACSVRTCKRTPAHIRPHVRRVFLNASVFTRRGARRGQLSGSPV